MSLASVLKKAASAQVKKHGARLLATAAKEAVKRVGGTAAHQQLAAQAAASAAPAIQKAIGLKRGGVVRRRRRARK